MNQGNFKELNTKSQSKPSGQILDSSYPRYDDMKEGQDMEEKLNENFPKISLQAQPFRSYLDSTVTETLVKAMTALDKERPDDPVEYLAYYILSSRKQ